MWLPQTLIKFVFLHDNWGKMPQLFSAVQVFAVVPVWGHCLFTVLTARFKSNGITAMLTRSSTSLQSFLTRKPVGSGVVPLLDNATFVALAMHWSGPVHRKVTHGRSPDLSVIKIPF